jgi:pimeloyl-ACP methyl ester carboxylesterase
VDAGVLKCCRRLPFTVLTVVGALLAAAPAESADQLDWADCGGGFECATLEVPRDWNDPDGELIELALIRLPATVGERSRLGSLLVNFGGPGAAGLTSLRQSGELISTATHGRLDVVSWDPRGVGESTPILCPEGNDAFFEADPDTPEGLAAMAAAVALRAEACSERYGSYLGALGTVQVIQDMDAIRRALGERKVRFLGQSYGTRLGAVYAQRYPERVRAMVLDGSMAPVSTLLSTSKGLAVSFEAGLHEWLRRCAASASCAFGDDPLAGYDALVQQFKTDPPVVPNSGGRRFGIGYFYQVVLAGITNYQGSTEFAEDAIAKFRTTGDPTTLLVLADAVTGRQPDGTYAKNANEIFQLVNCLDWQDRPTPEQALALAEQVRPFSPRLGPFAVAFVFVNSTACPESATPVPPPNRTDLPPLLVVGNDIDPQTPLQWSQELSEALPNSILLVWEGFGHTAFTTTKCVSDIAGDYLVRLRLPHVGTTCPPEPPE